MTGTPLTAAHPPAAHSGSWPAVAGGPPTCSGTGGRQMIGKLIKAALIAIVLAAIIQLIPDIKRYLELRKM